MEEYVGSAVGGALMRGARFALGQNGKFPSRADVFRFAPEPGHCLMQLALRICAISGPWRPHPVMCPITLTMSAHRGPLTN
jgi:hypothetical protein